MSQPTMKRITILCMIVFTASFSFHQAESLPSGASLSEGVKPLALTQTPQNIAAVVGDTIVLICEASIAPPTSRIMWGEFITTGKFEIISDTVYMVPHPNKDRYRIIHTSDTQYNLEIRDLKLGDGGKYRCQDFNDGSPNAWMGELEVIVLESIPVCTNTMRPSGALIEGETYSAECLVRYQGKYAPTMTWSGPQTEKISQTTLESNVVKSEIEFTVDRSMDFKFFTCLTNFTDIGVVQKYSAENTPVWKYTYKTNPLYVYWGPKNMYVEPLKKKYSVGDVLTCYADSFPAPFYQWLNTRTNEYVNAQRFEITESLAKTNQTVRCLAQNLLMGTVHSDQILVNVNVPKKN